MADQTVLDGGLQYVPQIAVMQIIYLDFDGELTSYNGEILTLDNVEVQDALLTAERINNIITALNEKYAAKGIQFVTQRPATADYSTIFVGKTDAFDQYGTFKGLAETIDEGNVNKTDKAFVNLDTTATDTEIIDTIAHETDHLTGSLNHGGEGLQAYADRYDVSSGITSSGITLSWDSMYVSSGGTANNTTVNFYGRLYVSSGGTANCTTVNSGGYLYVSSGGTANSTTVNSSGCLYVYDRGTANNTTVNGDYYGWGHLYVSSGGTANRTTVNSGGELYVYDRGTANCTTVNGGDLHVSSGGTANSTTVNSSGYLFVAGTANCTTVNSSGYLFVASGGTANCTTLNYYGRLYVASGGTANCTTLNYYGRLYVSSGGTANCTTLNYYGRLYVSSGGVANSTRVNRYGSFYVSSGGTATDIIWTPCVGNVAVADGAYVTYTSHYTGVYFGSANQLLSHTQSMTGKTVSGSMYVMAGGTANSTTVNSSGYLRVSSGGTATNIIWTPCVGYVHVFDGAYVTYTSHYTGVYFGSGNQLLSHTQSMTGKIVSGSMYVMAGGTANSTTVNGGYLYVSSGGTANNTTVNSGGYLYVYDRGTANYTTVNGNNYYYGRLYVSSGGTANSTTVNSGGELCVSSGGTANNTTVNFHGRLYVSSGGTANSTTVSGYGACLYVSSGGTANSSTVSGYGACLYVSSGGTANCTTVNDWGYLYVSSGGTANSTTVNAGGYLYVYSGGTATNIIWTPCVGNVYVDDGAYATYASHYTGVYFGSGNQLLSHTQSMTGKIVSNGDMYVMAGGTANSTTVNSGGDLYVYDRGTANSTTLNNGILRVWSGGTANSTTVNAGGELFVSSGGTANSTTVNSSGYLYVYSGGTATNIIWTPCVGSVHVFDGAYVTYASSYSGVYFGSGNQLLSHTQSMTGKTVSGSMYVMAGGTANSTTVNGNYYYYGRLYVSSGGTANSTTVNSGGDLYVSSGGTANSTTVNSGGELYVYDRGTANCTTVNGGDLHVSSGGTANCTTLNYYGRLYVSSGGTANSTTLNLGGDMKIYAGGTANSTTFNSGGWMRISSGGTANSTTVNSGGHMYISSGGTASHIVASAGARLGITVASNTYIQGTYAGSAFEMKDAQIDGYTVHAGGMYISSGGTANATTVNSRGSMHVSSGGTANSTTVNTGGILNIYNGGTHHGSLQIADGGSVYAVGTIDFTLDDRTTADDYLINNFSRITGAPTYTITVAKYQKSGTYKLAQGASSFTGSVTVGDGSVTYGTVTVNGEALAYNNTSYKLILDAGNLTFEVTAAEPVLNGGKNGVTFENIPGTSFLVDYSKDQFATSLQIETQTQAVDTYGLPAGTFQWQVTGSDGIAHQGENIVSDKTTVPEELVSDSDGNLDVFFGNANDVWGKKYAAQHLGNGTWEGTQEQVILKGKNKIADIFEGSTDANILVLTDDANGDALFVDDIYTALGDQERFTQIDEIRAGAGDDIVDMTSQRYAYTGSEIKIHGGDGNDTIWGGAETNVLYGDGGNDHLVGAYGNDILVGGSGNDSMHGGGGDDIFTFGGAFGNDTVEQLASGSVTLWFETGSESNWNAETGVYTDGTNTVSVSGSVNVTLRFGTATDLPAGAFEEETTRKVFEDKGMLA